MFLKCNQDDERENVAMTVCSAVGDQSAPCRPNVEETVI